MEDRQGVIQVLEAAASQDPARLAQAESSLKILPTRPGFHATLFDIFADRSVATQVRWMAIIGLKNGIDRYWKRSALHPIRLQEKELVRPRLLTLFDETAPQLAAQYCVTVAKIARWEFPRVWPSFAEDLLGCISAVAGRGIEQEPAAAMEHNALYTLHLFVKTLSARTLPLERQAFRQITPQVFQVLAPLYSGRIEQFHQLTMRANGAVAGNAQFLAASLPLLKTVRYCIKVLRRLWVFGFEKIEGALPQAQEFYLAAVGHQAAFFDLFMALNGEGAMSDEYRLVLRKIVLLYGKMHLDFQKYHAVPFIMAPSAQPLLRWYWEKIAAEAPRLTAPLTEDLAQAPEPALEPLLVQGLVLYKNVVKNYFYVVDEDSSGDEEVKRCREVIDGEILTPQFKAQMGELLMFHYIPLKPKDLERWRDDPEGWMADEEADYWDFDVRKCAEHLFVDLVNQERSTMGPELAALVQQPDVVVNGASVSEVHYRREGKYAALGLCATDLYDYVDFCRWLEQHHKVAGSESPLGIVKRRIAWLVGKWVAVKFPVEQRPSAYGLLLELAKPSEPLVVRIEALSSLMRCVDDWDFDTAQFAPYVHLSIERITAVLSAVSLPESRMRIVSFLGALVQRMQSEILPFAEQILQMVPPLWESAAGENTYQMTILDLITKIVEALGVESTKMQDFVAPLLKHSVDLDDPAHVYLMEDGINLWLMLVNNATRLGPGIVELLPILPRLLQYSTETLRKVLKIIEGYLLVDGAQVLRSKAGRQIVEALHTLVSDTSLTVRATIVGCNTLNILVQCSPAELAGPLLVEYNLLWTALTRIVDKKEVELALVQHAGFLARVAVHYPALFAEFMATQPVSVAADFTENWVSLFDELSVGGSVTQRRLFALAFAAAVGTATNDGVLKGFPLMVPVWTEIMSDMGESVVDGAGYDVLAEAEEEEFDLDIGAASQSERRKKLVMEDPAHKLNLHKVLRESMKECERRNGTEKFHSVIAQVDPKVLEDFRNQLE
ncbi:hypothetical protein GGF46_001863 [Coemansia sp. RSA 552]|nr:hypothetical protein GGF46_001863 [Coemansia sp. RSA 552]